MKRFLIFDELGNYVEDAINEYELLDGQTAIEVGLNDEITFHRPILLDGEIVEGKTAEEMEEDAFQASLIPSIEEQETAEFELKIITLLIELGLF